MLLGGAVVLLFVTLLLLEILLLPFSKSGAPKIDVVQLYFTKARNVGDGFGGFQLVEMGGVGEGGGVDGGSSKSELAEPMALLLLSLLELSLLALELALLLLLFSRIEVECSVAALCELAV